MDDRYLSETQLLDYNHPSITQLVQEKQWERLDDYGKIGAVYDFVRNDIVFGYNESDDIPASKVLQDGYGQCNTKSTLLMALLRKVGIPCRFHGFTINKQLQKGAIAGLAYRFTPQNVIHSWVEVYYQGEWINLEGCILDEAYLGQLQKAFPCIEGSFRGYGVATINFKAPPIQWQGKDTYIQKEGITQDYGVFDAPDDFYARYGANLGGMKKFLYKHLVRRRINSNVSRIRSGERWKTQRTCKRLVSA
jgi:hypothetical protein